MAYKFQSLAATMSGSLTQEGDFAVNDHSGVTKATIGIDGAMSGSGNFSAAGTVSLLGVAQAAVDVAADSLYYFDATDGKMKRETVGAFMTDIAGDGLIAASNQLAVQVDDSTIETNSDTLRLKDDGVTGAKLAPAVAGAGLAQDGSGNLDIGAATNGGIAVNANDIGMDISDLAAASIASGDTFAFDDSGTTKKESVDDLATLFAGTGLAAASAVLSVDLNELGAAAIASGDSFAFIDATDSNASKKETVDDLATLFAGDGLSASSAVLSIATSGSALTIASDKLGISGSIAGDCLDKGPGDGVDSIRTLHVVADESTIESVGRSSLRIKDDGVTGAKLAPAVAGYGLAQDGSGNLDVDLNELTAEAIASGDFLAFVDSTDNGTHKESVDDLATLYAGVGLSASSAVMAVDLNELSAAAVDVANDSIAIIDANDSNGSKKESIVDLVAGIAGAGLSAASGQLSVQGNAVALKQDGDTLVEGYNYFADASSDATVSMPANPSVGDVVTIKAGNLTSNAEVIVNRQGSHTIDGLTQIRLESPFASVTCVYVVANDWRIV